eukprot:6179717-Pleurochrysis_carterae.AAC.1
MQDAISRNSFYDGLVPVALRRASDLELDAVSMTATPATIQNFSATYQVCGLERARLPASSVKNQSDEPRTDAAYVVWPNAENGLEKESASAQVTTARAGARLYEVSVRAVVSEHLRVRVKSNDAARTGCCGESERASERER